MLLVVKEIILLGFTGCWMVALHFDPIFSGIIKCGFVPARHRRMPLWRWFSTHSTCLPAIQAFFLKWFHCVLPFHIFTNWLASGIFEICPKSVNFQAVRHPHLLVSQGKQKPQTIEMSMCVLTSCLWTNIVTSNRLGENRLIDEWEQTYTELKLDPISWLKLLQLTK